jgi:predicted nucleic acid-binding protein
MIVSNTSPLRYLIAVGHADLLHKVFGDVLIPPAVLAELTHPAGREDVRQWIEQRPTWLQVRPLQAPPSRELTATLDAGECEALQLAFETRPDFILIDERLGRRAGVALGLIVIGALGLLRESYRQQLLSDPLGVLDQMRRIGFRLSQQLYREFQQEIQLMRPS